MTLEEQAKQPKLYIVSHSDLPTQAPSDYLTPQVTHAAMNFAFAYPAEGRVWHETSNSIIALTVQNERKLWEFSQKLTEKGIRFVEFREPDLGNELTAIAICPGPDVKKACSGLPLAGKKVNVGASERLSRKFDIVDAMLACEQTSGQNMLQHGESVRDYLFDLITFLRDPTACPKYQWRFPQWVLNHARHLTERLPSDYAMEKYALWHDCGKPFCKTTDAEGKVHYPDHARVSAQTFLEIYPEEKEIANLIASDMDIHNLSGEEVEEFAKRPEAIALLLTGLAEIHSNAQMFGGTASLSFKTKWKHLDRRGNAICKLLFG